MKKIINLILVSFLMVTFVGVQAQTLIPRDDVETIKVYDELLVEKYPSFFDKKIVTDIYTIDETYSRIVYNDEGILTEELVYHQGDTKIIVAKTILISEDNVPEIVMDAFKKSPESKYIVTGYYEVSPTYGGPVIYAIEYNTGDKKERNFYSRLGRDEERPK